MSKRLKDFCLIYYDDNMNGKQPSHAQAHTHTHIQNACTDNVMTSERVGS